MDWTAWLGLEMTPARFARKVARVMQTSQPGLALTIDDENFRVHRSANGYFNLHNVFHAYRQAPRRERGQVIAQFVDSILNAVPPPTTYADVKPLLLPALRRKTLLDQVAGLSTPDSPRKHALACRDFGADALLVLVVDAEKSMSMVMEATLAQWDVTFEAALAAAMDNLRDLSADKFHAIDGAPGVVQGAWSDAYDSSRILLPDLLFRGVASGSPVVMAPTRETLLLAPAHHPAAQRAMLEAASQALLDSNRWCSTAMYHMVDGALAVYTPQDAEVNNILRRLEREILAADHQDQKQQLDQAHARDGIDIFVASYTLLENDGQVHSLCAWAENAVSLLPRTDRVALVRDGGEPSRFVFVDWPVLAGRYADLMQEMPGFPPRYKVTAFPTALFEELLAAEQAEIS